MKSWICSQCGRRGETEEDIIIKICNACQCEMEVLYDGETNRIYVGKENTN